MNWEFTDMISLFSDKKMNRLLSKGLFGIEREAQRITSTGDLALTPHPAVFGNKAENPYITTDFSESQIEIITSPGPSPEATHEELLSIHRQVEEGIKEERLWPISMPPRLPDEDKIPIARFSETEAGIRANIYRNGLALRYGKKMQMISGIHYNYSFDQDLMDALHVRFGADKTKRDFADSLYFSVARNFLRYRWLLIYLFGASPFCDTTYYSVVKREINMVQQCCPTRFDSFFDTLSQYATSLRVSRFGYSNPMKKNQKIFYNGMSEYSHKLRKMMSTRSSRYAKLGVCRNGSQIQLNENVLQKESEYYSSIRLKQTVAEGESQLEALESRGVKYLEVRILDINPFEKTGIRLDQMRFLQVFLLYCLFSKSPRITQKEHLRMNLNHHTVALLGRSRKVMLCRYGEGEIALQEWGGEVFAELRAIASLMDKDTGADTYSRVIESESGKLTDISLLPSEIMHRQMKAGNMSFLEYGIRLLEEHGEGAGEGGFYEEKRLRQA